MRIEFSHFLGGLAADEASGPVSFLFDNAKADEKLRLIDKVGFDRVIIDDPAELLSNMDLRRLRHAAPPASAWSFRTGPARSRQALRRASLR